MQTKQLRLPADQYERFRAIARRRDEPRAGLLLGWTRELHRAAVRGDPVPTDPGPTVYGGKSQRFTIDAEAARAADEALRARDSSLTIALRARVAAYIAADGDPVAMD